MDHIGLTIFNILENSKIISFMVLEKKNILAMISKGSIVKGEEWKENYHGKSMTITSFIKEVLIMKTSFMEKVP